MIKGNAGRLAELLKTKQQHEKKEKLSKMKVALEERKKDQLTYLEEEQRIKDKKAEEQLRLKSMLDKNAIEARKKLEERQRLSKKLPDYGDHNVFSYIFEPKIH